ncbi:MAG: hypothetical protein KH756_03855 [Firmicutes bacterium]|nr:hypothetical protein [Bacillota bacterium]
MREKTVEWALKEKIIAIVRGMEAKDCLRVAQALYDGGIRLMEITYDQRDPAQWAKTADAIGKIAEAFEGRMLVGGSAWPGISQGRAQPHQPCAHHGRGRHQ